MTTQEQLFVARALVKLAGADTMLAGASGLFGPLGTYAYGRMALPEDERFELVGRSALGSSIGGLLGTAAGVPVSMATGIPLLPGVVLSGLLGAAGGGAGAAYARRKQKRREKLEAMRRRKDPDKYDKS